jgi:uncharacterized caspase-like protein
VLLLLDACRSGAVAGDVLQAPKVDVLQLALKAINNVTVLTSSQADTPSREDEAWKHGAFTKVLLEAFGPACGRPITRAFSLLCACPKQSRAKLVMNPHARSIDRLPALSSL